MKSARKIIAYIATSADGYIARPNGDVEWLNRRPRKSDYGMNASTPRLTRSCGAAKLTTGLFPINGNQLIAWQKRFAGCQTRMPVEAAFPTMDLLRSLGFRRDPAIVSFDPSTIAFDFGILKLQATACLNLRCEQIILFSGVISGPRTLGEIHLNCLTRSNPDSFVLL
jgi:hypothetical protein